MTAREFCDMVYDPMIPRTRLIRPLSHVFIQRRSFSVNIMMVSKEMPWNRNFFSLIPKRWTISSGKDGFVLKHGKYRIRWQNNTAWASRPNHYPTCCKKWVQCNRAEESGKRRSRCISSETKPFCEGSVFITLDKESLTTDVWHDKILSSHHQWTENRWQKPVFRNIYGFRVRAGMDDREFSSRQNGQCHILRSKEGKKDKE